MYTFISMPVKYWHSFSDNDIYIYKLAYLSTRTQTMSSYITATALQLTVLVVNLPSNA